MVEIAALFPGSRPAFAAELAVERDEIDQRGARTELIQPERLLDLVHATAECVDVEGEALRKIGNPQHHMIERMDCERRHGDLLGEPNCRAFPGRGAMV
jgi:hypothetical protein